MAETSIPPGGPLPPPVPPGLAAPWTGPATHDTTSGPTVHPPRRGQLSPPWRAMVATAWVGVFVAYLAVWKASEQLGIATWWLGPRSSPQPIVVRLVPFLTAAAFGILASSNLRRLPLIGLVGAAILASIALPDLSRSTGLAILEFAIAGAVLLVSVASFTGTYRQTQEVPVNDAR